jgi:hypothetical protein
MPARVADPDEALDFRPEGRPSTLVIACGALARELVQVIQANRLGHIAVTCLPARLHNRPSLIPDAVAAKIDAHRGEFERILCLYGDCGTGGLLDRVLEARGVTRIEGAHCYQFFLGEPDFSALAEEEPGTFYLTDYLVRHFDRLVIEGLGLDRHPELLPDYFGNYTRMVWLAQVPDDDLARGAEAAAARLGLRLEVRHTGLGAIERFLDSAEAA